MSVSMVVALVAMAVIPERVEIALQPTKGDRTFQAWQKSLAGIDRPSPRTVETLKRYDLESTYNGDARRALLKLEIVARRQPDAEVVYALAELNWIEGRRLDKRRKPDALDRYLDSVAYAYDYLFDPELSAGRQPSDPRFRLAIDLYNGGVERIIRAAQAKGGLKAGGTLPLKLHNREQDVQVRLPESPWRPDDIQELLIATDFEVTGLDTRSHRYGLGVPLIGIRRAKGDAGPPDRFFFPEETAFPITAFLRPYSKLREEKGDVEATRQVVLDLVDTVRWQTVGQGASAMMLEADLTVPLAYMFGKTDLHRAGINGLFKPGQTGGPSGLMLLRPYEPSKIPVVMVHGLGSSPMAWIPMLNELFRDQEIQGRYQFLLYMYPTGVPVPIAASGLRDELKQLQARFDPSGDDPAFNQMVLLGHSMGGLLSHSMAVSSGNHYWELMSDRTFEEILGPPEVLGVLRKHLFFEALPFVKRVVFLATPHRGSALSRGMVGRLGSSLIDQPDEIGRMLKSLVAENPDAFDRKQMRRLPTSIETLDPDSPVLQALLEMKPGPRVTFHSVIGSLKPGPVATANDGVVPYSSSKFPGAASTLVVRSDHSVQRDPEAILEVRRILKENLTADPALVRTEGSVSVPAPAASR